MARLFIIGNGYDIARRKGDTKYSEFKKWLKKKYSRYKNFIDKQSEINFKNCRVLGSIPSSVFEGTKIDNKSKRQLKNNDKSLKRLTAALLLCYIDKIDDMEWNCFEDDLSRLPLKGIIKKPKDANINDNIQLQSSFGSPVDKKVDLITLLSAWIIVLFAEWIQSLEKKHLRIKKGRFDEKVIGHIRPDDTFIIFNYTETIENLFNLRCPFIFYHIHGIYNDFKSIVVGHNDKKYNGSYGNYMDDEEDYINQFYTDVYKCPEKVIESNQSLWHRISSYQHLDIYEYGWSCSQVDEDYIKQIVKLRKKPNVETSLHLNNYNGKGFDKAKRFIDNGFDKKHIYLYKEDDDIDEIKYEDANK